MGNPIQDATNALDEIFNDVQTRRTTYEEDFIRPLKLFPKQSVDEMDTIHDHCVQSVQTSMGKLFGPDSNFKGETSNAIAQMIGNYFDQESKLSNYSSNGISIYMEQLAQVCNSAVQDMEPHLDALKGANTSNILLNDIMTYWSNVFHKGPQALIDGLQVGPWTLGQITHGQIFSGSQTQNSSMMAPQVNAPQVQTPASGFWEAVAIFLAPFAAVVLVANIVTEVIKQFSLDWHVENLSLIALHWVQQMNDLHTNILMQNSNSDAMGNMSSIKMGLKSENAAFLLKRVSGMPDPNLSDDQKKLAQQLYKKYAALDPGVLTLAEIEYLVANFPANMVENKVNILIELKVRFPKLADGYLAFFVIQNIPYEQILQDIQWLQKASQNNQGTGPGNIHYMRGSVPSNPYVDFLTAETYRFEAQGANQLRSWMNQIISGQMTIQSINNRPDGAVKKFLLKTYQNRTQIARYDPNNPTSKLPNGYKGLFGTATQEMVKASIRTSPWYGNKYVEGNNLLIDSGSGSLRPDLQLKLPNGKWAALDYTTYDQLRTKDKYNVNPYDYNVILIHNGPFGGDEIISQS